MDIPVLKILMLEDVAEEAELIQRRIRSSIPASEFKVVMTRDEYIASLRDYNPHLILSDNEMPQFSGPEALEILKQHALDIPFILVTGTVSEEFAVSIIKAGADDYLLKDRLARLPAAIESALKIRQAEKEKQESLLKLTQNEKLYRTLIESSNDIISLLDDNFKFIYRSPAGERVTGWREEEINNARLPKYIHPKDLDYATSCYKECLANPGKAIKILTRYLHKDGRYIWMEGVLTNLLSDKNIKGIVFNFRDIGERLEAELKLIKVNRLYLFISQVNQMIVRTKNEQTLFKEVCEIAVDYGKFKMAWIGMVDQKTQKIVAVMYAGEDSGYFVKTKTIAAGSDSDGRDITATAVREGRTVFCNDIENNEQMEPWKQEAISHGYFSAIALPIKKSGKVVGAFTLYAGDINFFDNEEIRLLEEATSDISFALEFIEKENLRKSAEQKVLESEQSYHTLTEISPVGIFRTDANGLTTYVNPKWCEISGLPAAEALGNGWHKAIHKDDLKQMLEGWDTALGTKTHSLSEYRFVRPDGSIAWVYGQATPEMNLENEVIGYVGNITDISERKKAEEAILLSNERYDLVSKATNDSIWDLNILTGDITRTGDGFKTLFGYDDVAEINDNQKFNALMHPDDAAQMGVLLQKTFDNSAESYWEQEYRLLKADGNYAFVYDKGYIIRDQSGKAIRMIGAMQDITKLKENESHLKKLNESLLEQTDKLTASNEELERFAYVASHDMQEPLRMVTSFLVLLEKKYKDSIDDSGKRYIHFAVDGAKRMRQIILDLLDFSKVGQDYVEPQALNLNDLISEIRLLYSKQIEEKNAVIELDELPVITAAESPIRQVFQNLISNALKYSLDEKPVLIKIGVVDKGECWQFSVADNGIGISKEYFDKIFVIFKRLHNRDQFSGTGIGLAITKKIINKQGGKIWVESTEGAGTTFYFTLKK